MSILVTFVFLLLPRYFYNVKDTIQLAGKVMDLQREKTEGSDVAQVVMSITKGDSIYKVVLGPSWFVEQIPGIGDSCTVYGAFFRAGKTEYVIARSIFIHRTRSEIKLRTENGFPLWYRRGDYYRGVEERKAERVRGRKGTRN